MQDYLCRADDAKKERLKIQRSQAFEHETITCNCGQLRHLTHAFRCLYCGEWYCSRCAEEHFGQTIQQWIEKKRLEKWNELMVVKP